jgi:hypothetical protein
MVLRASPLVVRLAAGVLTVAGATSCAYQGLQVLAGPPPLPATWTAGRGRRPPPASVVHRCWRPEHGRGARTRLAGTGLAVASSAKPTISLDSRTANRTLVDRWSPCFASTASRSWQRFERCQANGRMGRFAEHESITAPVARSSNGSCPGRQGLAHRSSGARHGLSAGRTAWTIARSCSATSPLSFDRGSGPLTWEQRD